MPSTLGTALTVTVFGQSHSPAIGCVVEGLPSGHAVDLDKLQAFLDALYFNEIANIELVAVICPQRGCYAMTRAVSAFSLPLPRTGSTATRPA